MRIEEKKAVVDELKTKFADAKVLIVTDYKGLNVEEINNLRKQLRDAEVEYKVVKNTLLRRAAEDTEFDIVKDHFKGPSAIAYSLSDPVTPAKVLANFAKGNKKFGIKGGVLNGKALDLQGIQALSDLPSREVLLGQVLAAMNAVPTGFVRVLNEVPRTLLNVLQAIKDQKETA